MRGRYRSPSNRRYEFPGARGFKRRVFVLYGARCLVCGAKAAHAHHVVPLRTIAARGAEAAYLAHDARNGFPICVACHDRHERAFRRIWRHELLADHVCWARDHGFEWVIEKTYPIRAVA